MNEHLLVGIDLGGTHCRSALVRPNGTVVARRHAATVASGDGTALLAQLREQGESLIAEAASLGQSVAAIGVGVPGTVTPLGEVRAAPNLPQLGRMNLAQLLGEAFGRPVRVLNDANAATWGEFDRGAGRGRDSLLAVTLGTGVGGGLILAGQLWLGADGSAGELGHVVVEPDGRPCACGGKGCLERYASATGIVQSYREAVTAVGGDIQGLDAAGIARQARLGDRRAQEAYALAGRCLGQVLGGVAANLLNLEAVVLCGGVARSFDLLRPTLEKALWQHAFDAAAQRLRLLAGELGDDAGLIGAALWAESRLPA